MEPVPGSEVVPLNWSVEAMQRGLERVRTIGWNDPVGAFAALGETLWWIAVVSDQLRARYPAPYAAALGQDGTATSELLTGLRFARNRITHVVDEVNFVAATATNPSGFEARWTWKSLPPRADGHAATGHAAYEHAVAGRTLTETLMPACLFLATFTNNMWMARGVERHFR
jgi:hypothetical protein